MLAGIGAWLAFVLFLFAAEVFTGFLDVRRRWHALMDVAPDETIALDPDPIKWKPGQMMEVHSSIPRGSSEVLVSNKT